MHKPVTDLIDCMQYKTIYEVSLTCAVCGDQLIIRGNTLDTSRDMYRTLDASAHAAGWRALSHTEDSARAVTCPACQRKTC